MFPAVPFLWGTMRHKLLDKKLGRSSSHRQALMSSLVCSLIERRRIKTTLAKAKGARRVAERMVTLGKKGTLAARRRALSVLRRKEHVHILFDDIASQCKDRNSGYTRIIKLGKRQSDSSEMVFLEWVSVPSIERAKKKPKRAESKEAVAS